MQRLRSLLARPVLAPFAIPVFVATPLWQRNKNRLPYEDILPSVGMTMLLVGVLVLLIYALTRNWKRTALVATIWTAFLLYTPSLVSLASGTLWIRWALIFVVAFLVWDIARRVPKTAPELERANFLANVLLVPGALAIVIGVGTEVSALEKGRPQPQDVFAPFAGKATPQSPDVWHIVMDRYANLDTLTRIYGYDNRPFIAQLRKRGFAVNEQAHSNYQITNHSLASTLNADYLDKLGAKTAKQDDLLPLFRAVRRNQAIRFFQKQGYETIFAGTWANISVVSEIADRNINYRGMSEIPRIMIDQSVPGMAGDLLDLPYTDGRVDQCAREKVKFTRLREVAKEPGRKYVFAHFLLPHPPFIFAADGSCKTIADEGKYTRAQNYLAQVTYANSQLLSLIDTIQAGPRPATIVLHADEGPYPAAFAGDETFRSEKIRPGDNWASSGPDRWREKTGILMAIRHANGATTEAPPTPVNVYPLILNRSFAGKMPMKPEKTFIFRDFSRIYDFIDVTEAIR